MSSLSSSPQDSVWLWLTHIGLLPQGPCTCCSCAQYHPLSPPLPRPLFKCILLQKPFLISQRLPASGSLLFLSKCLGWGPGPSPVTQNLDMLPGLCWIWVQPWGQAVPGSTWHRGLSLSPAVGGNRVHSPRLPGYRWEGTASPHPGSPDFTNSASHPWLPCPECEAEAHLGHTLTHVTGPSSAAGQPASSNLRSPALCS